MKGTNIAVGGGVLMLMLAIGLVTNALKSPPKEAIPIQVQDSVDQRRFEKQAGQFERGTGISKVIEEHELDVFLQSKAGPLVPGPDEATLARANAAKLKAEKALEEFHALQLQQLAQFHNDSTLSE